MPAPTYRLETFGKLILAGGAMGTLSHQRRRLALLALLAASGDRGLSRDQLLAYLWPESATGNARHSLEQLLYAMRRALGETIFSGVNPLRLDPAGIGSDVADFERAHGRGAWAEAVALYAGPFLDGFHLEGAAEFARWVETERTRLAARYAEMLGRLATAAETAGDHSAEVQWRRRLVDADPLSSRSALGLMRALVISGDRTSALQHARIYEALVEQELESEPDPSISAYVAGLRTGGHEEHAARTRLAAAVPASLASIAEPPAVPVAEPATIPTAGPVAVPTEPVAVPVAAPSSRWRILALLAVAAVAAALAIAALFAG